MKKKKYEILRFQIFGFILGNFILKRDYMALAYVKDCFVLHFLEHTKNNTFEYDFCLWQNNKLEALEVSFICVRSNNKFGHWEFSDKELANFCEAVSFEINEIPKYKVCVSVSPQTQPLSFDKNSMPNTPAIKEKVLEAFWADKRPGVEKRLDGSLYLIQQQYALTGVYSFFFFSQGFLTDFLKFLKIKKIK